jgi:hypothetical protein
MNHELDYLIQGADIVRIIKSRRLAWLGHVARMEGHRVTRRVMEWKPMGRRMRGRPRKRWITRCRRGYEEDGSERLEKNCE